MRIQELQKILLDKKIDIAIFLNTSYSKKDPTITYLTKGLNIEFGLLTIPKKEEPKLFIPGFEYERIKEKTSIKVVKPQKKLWSTIKEQHPRAKTIGVNGDMLSINELKGIKREFKNIKDISRDLYELRSTKTEEETRRIENSTKITEKIFNETIKKIREMKSEKKIAEYMLKRTIELECEPAFPPIVASGKNAAKPHHEPENALNKGFIVIDYGVKKEGYCADITRTYYVGTPTRKEKELYNLVLKAQEAAIQKCTEGNTFEEVDKTARKVLGEKSKEFIHCIGHSLGIEVHDDLPKRKKRMKTILKKGMIITVEPGVYKKRGLGTRDSGYGIRIEDDIIIEKNKARNLTRLEKSLITIKA